MTVRARGRWRLSRKLALLCALAMVAGLAVGLVAMSGISNMNGDLAGVETANEGQKAVAEVDASHDNVMSDTLMVLRATDAAQHRDAASLLREDTGVLVTEVQNAIRADVSPKVTAAARSLLPEAQQFVEQAKATAATAVAATWSPTPRSSASRRRSTTSLRRSTA